MHTMLFERLQLLCQRIAGVVEVLEYGLQALGRDRFHTHQRSLDVRAAHGIEILSILTRFHGDLSEEDHVLG